MPGGPVKWVLEWISKYGVQYQQKSHVGGGGEGRGGLCQPVLYDVRASAAAVLVVFYGYWIRMLQQYE